MKNGELSELVSKQPPIEYDSLKVLANIMTQQETPTLKAAKTVEYMFREAVELIKMGQPFSFTDVAILVDASYKT